MATRTVEVRQLITVCIDETKFDEGFMRDFRKSMYPFSTLMDHIEHLAQLRARGLVDEFTTFIEGYGPPQEMGIAFKVQGCDEEIIG